MSEIENFYDAGNRKINQDRESYLQKIEEIRLRLEVVARECVEKYRSEYWEEKDKTYDSYRVIKSFWQRVNTSAVPRLVKADGEDFKVKITDTILYEWPVAAQRGLEAGGTYKDYRIPKWLVGIGLRPCIYDAFEVLENVVTTKEDFEEIILGCYKGEDQGGKVFLEKNGFAIFRMPPDGHSWGRYDYECYAYRLDFRRINNNLPHIPEFLHPKVINGFAEQIKSGRCNEYIGSSLIRAEKRKEVNKK